MTEPLPVKQSFLDAETAAGGRFVLTAPAENMIKQYDGLIQALAATAPPPSENVVRNDGKVGHAAYRTYTPKSATGPLPTLVWIHGGGYLLGCVDHEDLFASLLCEHGNLAVVSVEYRLSTEAKWPAQLDDSFEVYKWAAANAASFGGDPKRIMTGGTSAGGGLSFGTALRALKDPQLAPNLKGIVSLVPTTVHYDNVPEKYKANYTSYERSKLGVPTLDYYGMKCFYDFAQVDPKDPEPFPLLSNNLAKLPPTYLVSAGADPLRDDSACMEIALKEAGVKVHHDFYEGLPHVFWIAPGLPDAQEFFGKLFQGIEWLKNQA